MIPLRDTLPTKTVPFINTLLLVANVAAFVVELLQGERLSAFVWTWAFVPDRLFHPELYQGWTVLAGVLTAFTAMFLHGGLLHLAGNMLYLWIFGDNVEDELGHFRYLVFYLSCGVLATALQAALDPRSKVPNLGASGAIAGVLAAYFVFHPHARIVTVVPLFILFPLIEVPAGLYLLGWFLLQFWNGSASFLAARGREATEGGIAWWAHVGGFVGGLLLVPVLRPAKRPPTRVRLRRVS